VRRLVAFVLAAAVRQVAFEACEVALEFGVQVPAQRQQFA
jgi:hypothetical protein